MDLANPISETNLFFSESSIPKALTKQPERQTFYILFIFGGLGFWGWGGGGGGGGQVRVLSVGLRRSEP